MVNDRIEPKQVAHGFNEELTIILSSSWVASRMIGPEHPAIDLLEEVHNAVRRCAALTRELQNRGQATQSPIISPASC